jgi:MFS family permease
METKLTSKIKSALRYSTMDGVANAVMLGAGESYILAYAILMSASDLQLSIIATLPILIASIFQLYSIKLMHKMQSRKKIVILFASIQALTWIPIAILYNLNNGQIPNLIFFVTLYWAFGLTSSPVWTSWMGDLVPEKHRGKFFGRRHVATAFALFVSFMIGGLILSYAKETLGEAYIGFAILFGIAMIARLFSVGFLSKQYEPKLRLKQKDEFTLKDFLFHFKKRFKRGHFNTVVLYLAFTHFAIYLSAPFFVAFMLKSLNFTYMQYVIAIASNLVVQMILFPAWGKFSDKYGSLAILRLTGILIAFNPFFWLFASSLTSVIIIQIYAGFTFSGFLLSSFNFMLETTKREKRATSMSYYALVNGVFIFLGSITGALLIKLIASSNLQTIPIIGAIFWSHYMPLFLISAILRLISGFTILPRLKDVERHTKISSKDLAIQVISSVPGKGLHINAHVHHPTK